MEGVPGSGYIDKSKVLSVKPLRSVAPVFPGHYVEVLPFPFVQPRGPFPSGVSPNHPQGGPDESPITNNGTSYGFNNSIPAPVPLNSYRMPEGDDYSSSPNHSDQHHTGCANNHGNNGEAMSNRGKRKGKSQGKANIGANLSSCDVNINDTLESLFSVYKLMGLAPAQQADGNNNLVERILLVYNLIRRKIFQIDEGNSAITRRPDMTAGTALMTKGVRTNSKKRVGNVPGIEVGDIFFFRMEMCLVGLHAPVMAGIDYMGVKNTTDEDPLALSVVSSGGYEDDVEDADILVYSGQGGIQRRDKQVFDQKLERGNLALEKSLHRGNVVRVIRGLKDIPNGTGKIYVYDGLYKILESWVERGKGGFNVFKYKFVRIPGQPEAFRLWKSIQQWKDGVDLRAGVILPDLTSGAENLPVCLVNDIDNEKCPFFTYIPSLKYNKPFDSPNLYSSCTCKGGCQPGNCNCPCVQRNGGFLQYTSLGVLLSYKSVVHECGPSCLCPPNCRNRISQAGLKVRLEVFKTKNRGWGLRSWDAIRSGCFICEYAGVVIDRKMELGSKHNDYIFDSSRVYVPLELMPDVSGEVPFQLVISAKKSGNVARFMNHSCSPNVFWQPIIRGNNNESYLHIGFFAIGHIPPMQELTFDYGIPRSDEAEHMKKNCLCGSSNCRGYFY